MNIIITIVLITIAQIIGCYLLNDNGALNKHPKSLIAGIAACVLSAYFAVIHFGAPSGLFVYLGLLSTIAMLFALLGFARRDIETK